MTERYKEVFAVFDEFDKRTNRTVGSTLLYAAVFWGGLGGSLYGAYRLMKWARRSE
jgi:hypothetical protein